MCFQAIQADGEKLMSESTIGTDEIAAHLKALIDNWEELKSLSDARASRFVFVSSRIKWFERNYKRADHLISIIKNPFLDFRHTPHL